jgi:hypothetical protein
MFLVTKNVRTQRESEMQSQDPLLRQNASVKNKIYFPEC